MSKLYGAIILFLIILCGLLLTFIIYANTRSPLVNPSGLPQSFIDPKPLQKYAFTNLSEYVPQASKIEVREVIADEIDFTSYLFAFQSEGKTMTGQLNIPKAATPSAGFPVIVMVRGFVDPSIYQTGIGTKNGAAYFAKFGFATIAPDFFGYGSSDAPLPDIMGERLQKPLNLLDLLASLDSLPVINPRQLGIWAHSNGGQIALSLLEISGRSIPTTLWAPVSKPFPYSILYYTDEADDQGKTLRKTVSDFESVYDVFDFSIDKYFDRINAPILVHQGTADDAVPVEWSTELAQTLQSLEKNVKLYTYPGTDHNLRQSWDTVISRDLEFFNSNLTKE